MAVIRRILRGDASLLCGEYGQRGQRLSPEQRSGCADPFPLYQLSTPVAHPSRSAYQKGRLLPTVKENHLSFTATESKLNLSFVEA